jgi:hypothetical protein
MALNVLQGFLTLSCESSLPVRHTPVTRRATSG